MLSARGDRRRPLPWSSASWRAPSTRTASGCIRSSAQAERQWILGSRSRSSTTAVCRIRAGLDLTAATAVSANRPRAPKAGPARRCRPGRLSRAPERIDWRRGDRRDPSTRAWRRGPAGGVDFVAGVSRRRAAADLPGTASTVTSARPVDVVGGAVVGLNASKAGDPEAFVGLSSVTSATPELPDRVPAQPR